MSKGQIEKKGGYMQKSYPKKGKIEQKKSLDGRKKKVQYGKEK